MESVMGVVTWLLDNYQPIVSATIALLSGATALALLIPGDQPEKFLQGVVDFLSKFSKK